jgi:hypothetical protein
MVATSIIQAVDSLVAEVVTPSQYEQKIILRLLQSVNKILHNLFGTETFVVGIQVEDVV